MVSRLDAVRDATRPRMHGRAMLSGPSGAGKTWTALSIATRLAADEDRPGSILVIDTERESALTYADVFSFRHLPWRAPYDPTELADVLTQIGEEYAVVSVDSFSHFWRGLGGTLDIADGKFGGWKSARPVQERLVDAVLSVPAHVILCVRSKMDYLVTQNGQGKQEITKVGLAPIQDETLVYEMNVAMDIDLEHRITVTKSRTPAVPVGRMYPAGLETKAADDYAGWLAGGVPPASREDVETIVARFADVVDAELRKAIKAEFVQTFGMPASLTAERVPEARAWLEAHVDGNDDPTETDETGHVPGGVEGLDDERDRDPESDPESGQDPPSDVPVPDAPDDHETAPLAADDDLGADPGTPDPEPDPETAPDPASRGSRRLTRFRSLDEVIAHVKAMGRATILAELTAAGVVVPDAEAKARNMDSIRRRLAEIIARASGLLAVTPPDGDQHPDDGTLGV